MGEGYRRRQKTEVRIQNEDRRPETAETAETEVRSQNSEFRIQNEDTRSGTEERRQHGDDKEPG